MGLVQPVATPAHVAPDRAPAAFASCARVRETIKANRNEDKITETTDEKRTIHREGESENNKRCDVKTKERAKNDAERK